MSLKRLVSAEKQITKAGAWASGSKMPKSAFPLSKQAKFKVGSCFRWRLVEFTCEGADYRLLIFYRLDLLRFTAMLGRDDGGDMCVLARYEFHGSHPGWHSHVNCGKDAKAVEMAGRTGNLKHCIPRHGKHNRNREFRIDGDDRAYYVAAKKFGLLEKYGLPTN